MNVLAFVLLAFAPCYGNPISCIPLSDRSVSDCIQRGGKFCSFCKSEIYTSIAVTEPASVTEERDISKFVETDLKTTPASQNCVEFTLDSFEECEVSGFCKFCPPLAMTTIPNAMLNMEIKNNVMAVLRENDNIFSHIAADLLEIWPVSGSIALSIFFSFTYLGFRIYRLKKQVKVNNEREVVNVANEQVDGAANQELQELLGEEADDLLFTRNLPFASSSNILAETAQSSKREMSEPAELICPKCNAKYDRIFYFCSHVLTKHYGFNLKKKNLDISNEGVKAGKTKCT